MNSFVVQERARQSDFFNTHEPGSGGYRGAAYRLEPSAQFRNLEPTVRETIPAYFSQKSIQWHTHSNHGLSSQVCCLNFLAPLARKPAALARLVQAALGGDMPTMLPVEDGPDGPWFVGFEWIGGDHLNETGPNGQRSRGANATSADAVLMFERLGRRETLLIEWKYTESYGTPIDPVGNATRVGRYATLAFQPHGPIRSDLGLAVEDFFWEPYYQLLRQQMLARHMERRGEDGADIVRLLHLSPAANLALKSVTAPKLRAFGAALVPAWSRLLHQPDRFVGMDIHKAFAPLLDDPCDAEDWARYVSIRYPGILAPDDRAAG